jgi:signal transduction histidine kinase
MLLKTLIIFIISLFLNLGLSAQSNKLPSLLSKWNKIQDYNNQSEGNNSILLLDSIATEYYDNQPDSALYYAKIALDRSLKNNYILGQVKALSLISRVNYRKSEYDLSLNAGLEELRLSKIINYEAGKASSLNCIGLIYLVQDNFPYAMENFKKASAINKKLKDYGKLSSNYINIGICLAKLKQPEKAIQPLTKAFELASNVKDFNMLTIATNWLGETNYLLGNHDKALYYFTSVIENKSYQNDWENSFAFSGLANTYLAKGNFQKAIKYGQTGLFYAKKIEAKWDIERSLNVLYRSYAASKDYKQAFTYLELNEQYSEKLFNEKKESEINALHLKQQQIENKDLIKQNKIDQQQISLNRILIISACILTVSLLIIIFLVFRNYKEKNKVNKQLKINTKNIAKQNKLIKAQNQELSQLNSTKDQLFSIIGHDLRSPFASIIQTMHLIKENDLTKDEIAFVMDKFFEKITLTAAMLDNLLLWANNQKDGIKGNFKDLNLSATIGETLSLLSLVAIEKRITINHRDSNEVIINADIDHIKVIFQNLIGNAIKFTGDGGKINIFYEEDDEFVHIHVKDNGVGIPENKLSNLFKVAGEDISTHGTNNEKGVGIGLMLVKKFMDVNNADLKIFSEQGKGTEFVLSFRKVTADLGANRFTEPLRMDT